VVGAHFATVDCIFGAHAFLDEGVAGFAEHRYAAGFAHHLDGVPGESRIVDHLAAGVARQQGGGEQADQVVALDEATVSVEEEAAVEVAIPGHAEVGTVGAHGIGGGGAAFWQQRVGNAVGEMAVRFVLDADELKRQMRRELVDHQAGAAVAGVDHDLQRFQSIALHVAKQVLDVGGLVAHHARRGGAGGDRGLVASGKVADREQAAVAADRARAFAHQFHAVVVHRVVTGGDHDAAGCLQMIRLEVDLFGATHADVDQLAAGGVKAIGQGCLQRRAAHAHVASEHHRTGSQLRRHGQADAARQIFVEFIGNAATDVVGLETGEWRHGVSTGVR
jgi:hypothetical protein